MRKDIKKYSDSAYEMVADVSSNLGSRLPGSDEEKKFAQMMADKISDIGLKPKIERFIVAPRASIGGIPYIGWAGLVACLMLYFEQLYIVSFAICVACWVFAVIQVFLYAGLLDFLFHQEISHNVYTELLPPDGKYDYTIMLSAHMDTSWMWKHSAKNPNTVVIKMLWGIIGLVVITVASLSMFVLSNFYLNDENWVAKLYDVDLQAIKNFYMAMKFVPLLCAPGLYFVTMWCSKNKNIASPGAMDNLTGIAINYELTKFFKENPDKMPKNCRIIDMNFGSEEAGLKGAHAFVKDHKGEDILKNLYALNVDSIADKDYFECINGDSWQFTRFDKGLEKMFMESMKEVGIKKPKSMKNPVGGCDSTPLCRAGVPTITFAAQNPIITEYYHTYKDVAERFDAETMHTGMEVLLKVIEKIEAKETNK